MMATDRLVRQGWHPRNGPVQALRPQRGRLRSQAPGPLAPAARTPHRGSVGSDAARPRNVRRPSRLRSSRPRIAKVTRQKSGARTGGSVVPPVRRATASAFPASVSAGPEDLRHCSGSLQFADAAARGVRMARMRGRRGVRSVQTPYNFLYGMYGNRARGVRIRPAAASGPSGGRRGCGRGSAAPPAPRRGPRSRWCGSRPRPGPSRRSPAP